MALACYPLKIFLSMNCIQCARILLKKRRLSSVARACNGVAEIISLDRNNDRDKVTLVEIGVWDDYKSWNRSEEYLMKLKIGIFTVAVVLFALGTVPFAGAQTNVSMSFNGSYSAVSCIGPDGCVGAGLYGGTINGVNVGPGQSVPGMICDDYFDHIYTNETWTASGVQVSSLNSGNIGSLTLFGNSIGVSGYTEVAYLANLMLTSSGLTSAQQAGISEAIWFITSKGASGALASGSWGYTYWQMAMASGATLSQYANLYLYMPTPPGAGEPQEMWSLVAVPEGGTALSYLLLAGLCCFGAIRFRRRPEASVRLS